MEFMVYRSFDVNCTFHFFEGDEIVRLDLRNVFY